MVRLLSKKSVSTFLTNFAKLHFQSSIVQFDNVENRFSSENIADLNHKLEKRKKV